MPRLQITRIEHTLPEGFRDLLDVSLNEGVQNMALLAERWMEKSERFDGNGEALFAALYGDEVIGLAGVSQEHTLQMPAMRMRRLYVVPMARRQGVARKLAAHCITHGFDYTDLLSCNARATDASGPFWEAMGFQATTAYPNITHIYHKG